MKQYKMLIVVLLLLTVLLSACGDVSGSEKLDEDSKSQKAATEQEDVVLLNTDTVKVSYHDLYETHGISAAYLQLIVENKTDKTVWIYLDNTVVNGYSIMAASGVPMTIQAGAKSKNPFILTYQQFDAQSIEDIKTVEFELVQNDNDTSKEIYRSERLALPIE